MKQYEFTKNYGENKKGDVIDHDMLRYHTFIHPLLMKGILRVTGSDKVKSEDELIVPNSEDDIKSKLLKLKMNVLRKFGKGYDAKDTDKGELVDEIIEKAPLDDIKKFLEDD